MIRVLLITGFLGLAWCRFHQPYEPTHAVDTRLSPALVKLYAKKNHLNEAFFLSQMRAESGLRVNAVSPANAQGIAQITPETAKSWGVDPSNPRQSLDVSARHMAAYVRTYERQGYGEIRAHELALAAYNAGPGAVHKYHGIPPFKETKNYIRRIFSVFKRRIEPDRKEISYEF